MKRLVPILLVMVGLCAAILYSRNGRRDATRIGPERTLRLEAPRVSTDQGGRAHFEASCSTNLPDESRVRIELWAGSERLDSWIVGVRNGRADVNATRDGVVTAGSYHAFASFRLEEQPVAIREALRYQPRSLESRAVLTVRTSSTSSDAELASEIKRLLKEANANPGDAQVLARCGASAGALERRLWISTLVPAARRLKRALEAAAGPEQLRRDLVEVDVLSDSERVAR